MEYCEAKPKKVMSIIIDFYYLAIITGFLLDFSISIIGRNFLVDSFLLIQLGLILLILIIYYVLLEKRILFRSPGEIISGKIMHKGEKKWVNPYCRNRVGIYIFIFITLIILGNNFDKIYSGMVRPVYRVLGNGLQVLLMSLCYYLVSKGKINAIFIPIALYFLGGIGYYLLNPVENLSLFLLLFGLVIACFGIVVWVIYRKPIKNGVDSIDIE